MSTGTNRRPLSAIAGLATGVFAGTNVVCAQIPCGYDVTIIQSDLDCGGLGNPITIPTGMNELGHVVGYHYCLLPQSAVPFLWTPEAGFTSITPPPEVATAKSADVNDALQIAGTMGGNISPFAAYLYDRGTFLDLGLLPGALWSGANALNRDVQIVGSSSNPVDGPAQAFLWESGVMMGLELPLGPNSTANDINDANSQIVGWMGPAVGIDSHAFLWEDGVVTDLGLAPNTFSTWANAVSSVGHVLVRADFNDDEPTDRIGGSFLWSDGRYTDLGALPGYDVIDGRDLNDQLKAVGMCRAVNSSNAPDVGFVWGNGVMIDLNELIPNDLRISIQWAASIDNAGRIAARGNGPAGVVALLLTPAEPPVGDFDGDCHVGASDLLILLTSWGPCGDCESCPADLDGDCEVGASDLLTLLVNWG